MWAVRVVIGMVLGVLGVLAVLAPAPVRAGSAADALLTFDDLPAGFRQRTPQPRSEPNPDSFCGVGFRELALGPVMDGAEAGFERSSLGPIITHVVAVYEEAPAGVTDQLWIAWHTCEWDAPSTDGTTDHWRIEEISFPALGDESVAFRLDVENSNGLFAAAGDMVIIRHGRALSILLNLQAGFGFTTVNSDLTERLARAAAAKLPTALP